MRPSVYFSGPPWPLSTSGPLERPTPVLLIHTAGRLRLHMKKKKKHSSPEAVKTFIIITNLQASTEPAGARCQAGSSAPRLSTFHHSALGGCKDLFYAGRKKKKKKSLFIDSYIATVPFLKTERWGEECVCACVCEQLSMPEKKHKLFMCVCACSACLFFLENRQGLTFLCSCPKEQVQNAGVYVHPCVDAVAQRGETREAEFAFVVCALVCAAVMKGKTIPPRTREKHNGGNKSGQRCRVLS